MMAKWVAIGTGIGAAMMVALDDAVWLGVFIAIGAAIGYENKDKSDDESLRK